MLRFFLLYVCVQKHFELWNYGYVPPWLTFSVRCCCCLVNLISNLVLYARECAMFKHFFCWFFGEGCKYIKRITNEYRILSLKITMKKQISDIFKFLYTYLHNLDWDHPHTHRGRCTWNCHPYSGTANCVHMANVNIHHSRHSRSPSALHRHNLPGSRSDNRPQGLYRQRLDRRRSNVCTRRYPYSYNMDRHGSLPDMRRCNCRACWCIAHQYRRQWDFGTRRGLEG